MLFNYDILPKEKLVVIRCSGPFSAAAARRLAEGLWADPLYSPSFNAIADLSRVSVGTVSAGDARLFGKFLADHPMSTFGHVAVVFGTPVATALAMVLQGLVRHRIPLKVFSTWEGACAYVGVRLKRPEA